MALTTLAFALANQAMFGAYTVATAPGGISVSRGELAAVLQGQGGLTCLPSASPRGTFIAIGHTERLSLIDNRCKVQWTISGLEYITSPGAVIAGESAILYYNGPHHISRSSYRTRSQFITVSRKESLIEARSLKGKLLWSKAWIDVGLPRASIGSGFITVLDAVEEAGLKDITIREIGANGRTRKRYRLAETRIGTASDSSRLGRLLTSEDVLWRTVATKQGSVYQLTQIMSGVDLDVRRPKHAFEALVKISSGKVTILVQAPERRTIVSKSATAP